MSVCVLVLVLVHVLVHIIVHVFHTHPTNPTHTLADGGSDHGNEGKAARCD